MMKCVLKGLPPNGKTLTWMRLSISVTSTFTSRLSSLNRAIQLKRIKSRRKWRGFLKAAGICERCLNHAAHLVLLTLLLSFQTANAQVPDSLAVRAIVGEAANQGELGMIAVAEAIRNRGHLKGVYGLNRDTTREPSSVWPMAKTAWEKSKSTNLVKGASVWGTESDVKKFSHEAWFKNVEMVVKIKDHYFFKEKRHGGKAS